MSINVVDQNSVNLVGCGWRVHVAIMQTELKDIAVYMHALKKTGFNACAAQYLCGMWRFVVLCHSARYSIQISDVLTTESS